MTANLSESAGLCTQYRDASGGRYFPRWLISKRACAAHDWSAFWLFCANRPRIYGNLVRGSNPLSWTHDIDFIEADSGSPNAAFCTLHANTSRDGDVPDELIDPYCFSTNRRVHGSVAYLRPPAESNHKPDGIVLNRLAQDVGDSYISGGC